MARISASASSASLDWFLAATTENVLEHEVVVGIEGLWLAAAAYGGRDDPYTVGAPVFAHTSPVYVNVVGRRVARASSAHWCLRQLDLLQEFATDQGRFDPERAETQLSDLIAVLDRARNYYLFVAAQSGR